MCESKKGCAIRFDSLPSWCGELNQKNIMFESSLKCYPYASQFYIPSMIVCSWISEFIFMSNLLLKACVVGLKWHQGSWWITFIQGSTFCGEIWVVAWGELGEHNASNFVGLGISFGKWQTKPCYLIYRFCITYVIVVDGNWHCKKNWTCIYGWIVEVCIFACAFATHVGF